MKRNQTLNTYSMWLKLTNCRRSLTILLWLFSFCMVPTLGQGQVQTREYKKKPKLPPKDLSGAMLANAQYNFASSALKGVSLQNPTSLQFGPDGRLYVSEQGGLIKAFTIVRNGFNDY